MTSHGSISFDHAADFYDKTRALTPEAAAQVTDLLHHELRGRESVLEVGVGTGRIALPLAGRRIPLIGVDLAQGMLAKLMENAGGTSPFPLVRGDATRLPFATGSFDAAIVSWVLHLIPRWRDALDEVVRVVGSGGILLIDIGREHQSITTELTWRFRRSAGVTDWPRGAKSYVEVDDKLLSLGAIGRDLDTVVEIREMALEEHIALLEQGVYSVAWSVDEGTRVRAADEVRAWSEERYGPITEVRPIETAHVWRAYDL